MLRELSSIDISRLKKTLTLNRKMIKFYFNVLFQSVLVEMKTQARNQFLELGSDEHLL